MKASARMDLAKRNSRENSSDAFTRLEFTILLATFCLLALVVLPLLANTSMRSNQTSCLNNLRQIGVAFQAWGNDHDDRRPWVVSYGPPLNEGGTANHPLRNNIYIQYSCLSNYMAPQLLIDPAETNRSRRIASNWGVSPDGGFLNPGFANNAVSYILGLHGTMLEANEILSGDRNLQFGSPAACSYGIVPVQNLESGQFFRGWTNGVHGISGNVLISDGHVEYSSQSRLKAILEREDDATGGGGGHHMLTPF